MREFALVLARRARLSVLALRVLVRIPHFLKRLFPKTSARVSINFGPGVLFFQR